MTDDAPNVYACLWAEGSFDPTALDSLLGVRADSHRRGELRRNGQPWASDSWHYSTEQEQSWDWADHLERVLDLLRPHLSEFLDLRDRHKLELGVHIVATATAGTPAATISSAAIKELASLGCSLEMDLYCDSADEHE